MSSGSSDVPELFDPEVTQVVCVFEPRSQWERFPGGSRLRQSLGKRVEEGLSILPVERLLERAHQLDEFESGGNRWAVSIRLTERSDRALEIRFQSRLMKDLVGERHVQFEEGCGGNVVRIIEAGRSIIDQTHAVFAGQGELREAPVEVVQTALDEGENLVKQHAFPARSA